MKYPPGKPKPLCINVSPQTERALERVDTIANGIGQSRTAVAVMLILSAPQASLYDPFGNLVQDPGSV